MSFFYIISFYDFIYIHINSINYISIQFKLEWYYQYKTIIKNHIL